MKNLILVALTLTLISGSAFAAEISYKPDPTSAAFGARPLGMGGAFIALADDTNAIFTNPAGLASLGDWSLTSMSTKLFNTVDYKLVGGTFKLGVGTVGIGYINTSAPAGYEHDEFGALVSTSPITYSNNMVLLSYGTSLTDLMSVGSGMGNLDIGATVKAISESFSEVEGATASGMDLDLGVKVEPENSAFAYGAVLENVSGFVNWVSGTVEKLEQISKFGTSVKVIGENALFANLPGEMVANIDFALLSDFKPVTVNAGAEYKPLENVSLRVGVDSDPLSGEESSTSLTAGVGVEYAGFTFDYAYKSNSDSQELSSHYFSISFSPETSEKNSKKVETSKKKDDNNNSNSDVYELPEEYKSIYLD